MRITILTWSTRGEVQPYVALGRELERRGHRVVLGVNENHVNWVRQAGLTVAPLPLDFQTLMTADSAASLFASGETGSFLVWLARHEHEHRQAIGNALMDACRGADAIVSGLLLSHRASAIAEAMGASFVRALIYPVAPTAEYSSPFLASGMPDLPRTELRVLSHARAERILLKSQRPDLDEFRARLALPPLAGSAEDDLNRRGVHTIHLFDDRVLPRPGDWPAHLVVGGYCFLASETRLRIGERGMAPELERWLDGGSPPVFVSFGSMPIRAPAHLLLLVQEVCRDLGTRAIVDAGWSPFPSVTTDDVVVVRAIDHDALLPRCRAAVHHGGAGTTAATLAAGIPTVICSVLADQPLWGHRVVALGVGATLPFQRIDRNRLRDALRNALGDDVGHRARKLGAELRATDGLARSVDFLLEALMAQHHSRGRIRSTPSRENA